uniref:Neur_chan_memb domain-containing protein n=2 Tax=Mesocestoides corti TaxID=53468 RepID=A0A5K3FYW4_MESCO
MVLHPFAGVIVLIFIRGLADCRNTKMDLFEHLLTPQRYNRLLRPEPSSKGPTTVHLGLRLSQFINVDERKEVIKTQAWVEQEWNDPQLVWDPAEFDGILSIHVPAEDIWRPDIVLYNNVDGKYEITTLTRAEVFFNGTVRWMPPALYLSFCRIDMEYFPYDEQTCSMRFGSWTYDGSKVELRHHLQKYAPELSRPLHIDYAADLYNFGSTVEYDIVSVSAICQDQDYKHSLHPEVTFYLRMRRRTIFYTFNLMLPCVAITTLAVVTFYLPPECREKISLSITIFLSLSLFFLLISETTPPTSLAVPLIGKYLLFTIVLITSSIMVTVMVLNIHFRSDETHTMDLWTRRVFLEILPPLLGLHAPKQRRPPESHKANCPSGAKRMAGSERTLSNNGIRRRQVRRAQIDGENEEEVAAVASNLLAGEITHRIEENHGTRTQVRVSSKLYQVAEGSRFIEQRLNVTKTENDIREEWKFVAVVVDRLSFWLFSLLGLICTFSIIFRSPTFLDTSEPLSPSNLPIVANLTSFIDSAMRLPNQTVRILLPKY